MIRIYFKITQISEKQLYINKKDQTKQGKDTNFGGPDIGYYSKIQ